MAKGNGQIKDISAMTDAEIAEYLKARKAEQAKLVAAKGVQAKKELEAYCLKTYGISLAAIFTSSENASAPKTYRNPGNGENYTYSGRGKVPTWLKDDQGKPNVAYLVKTN
jgi:DNA-binding protein H-NS